jgi:hypothetical protein
MPDNVTENVEPFPFWLRMENFNIFTKCPASLFLRLQVFAANFWVLARSHQHYD